jgi:cell pole-organizing protein PopZ
MRPIALVNEILPLVIRAIETGDRDLLVEAQEALRPNLTEWLDAETNELVENLDCLLTAAEESCEN